jgi:EAL domain-containing protein (putative c-di-GMP-specific phosphodiesterase class I)
MPAFRFGHSMSGLGPRTFRSYAEQPAALVAVLVVAAVLLAWRVSVLAGGSSTGAPQLFYIPIVLAAVRFGYRFAMLTALACGLLAGPLLPADVATQTPQSLSVWLLRLLIFVSMAVLLAWLTSHTRPGMLRTGRDAQVAAQLRAALRTGQLEVHYQPQVALNSGEPVGVEALVRWRHPRKGLVPPDQFVPSAERTGVIADIDEYVLREAVQQLADWSARGLGELSVAVNVSARRFHDRDLLDVVRDVVSSSALDPARIHLEITETAIIDDPGGAARLIGAIRDLGVKVAIDDFGTGQSSLSYLHQFTVDIVKIDRRFVSTVVHDPKVSRLVAGLIRLFESIGVGVVCEGVEDAEQLVHMEALGGQIGQGYFFAKPAPAEETWRYLSRQSHATNRQPADMHCGP